MFEWETLDWFWLNDCLFLWQQRLVQDLTEVERVEAARTSYAFWFLERTKQCPSYETQLQMAAREARRHLAAVEGNYPKALQRLQEACNYRMVRGFILLHEWNRRQCFLTTSPKTFSLPFKRNMNWTWYDLVSFPMKQLSKINPSYALKFRPIFKSSQSLCEVTTDNYVPFWSNPIGMRRQQLKKSI